MALFICGQGESKDGADAEPSGEAASRGRGNFRATARKLSVTDSLTKNELKTAPVSKVFLRSQTPGLLFR
jgi:hypothetical protein